MTPQEVRQTIQNAQKFVSQMPPWKQGYLAMSAEPKNSKPRTPVVIARSCGVEDKR